MFGTSGIRGRVGSDVTADLALSVGRAVASLGAERVVVGRDARESGDVLRQALAAGLRESGADVVDVGVAATPTIARAVAWQDADVGVSITASHNPPEDNGIKLWNPNGQAFDEAQRAAVTAAVSAGDVSLRAWDELGTYEHWAGAHEAHVRALCKSVSKNESGAASASVATADSVSTTGSGASLDSLSIVVDVGNGVGGVTADALYELGCTVETMNAQPDGRFPARPSEPTAETCASLCAMVEAIDADLGIAHDGDADRMMAVTGDGEFVPGDLLLALFAREAAGEGDSVAAPLNTSLLVDDALASAGASLSRTRVGDVFVADRLAESGGVFGGEMSGAWIWPAETHCPDGPLAACRLADLVATRGPLADLVADLDTYPIRRESIEVADKTSVMERIEVAVAARYDDVETMDGVRVDLGDAWFLVRASGTQPLVRVTAEARTANRADDVFEAARSFVSDVTG